MYPNRHDPVWLARLGLFLLAGATYAFSLRAPFIFDDAGAVVTNESLRQWSTAWNPPDDGSTTTGRPLLNFIFALNYHLSGLNVLGWHVGNVLLHGLATVLLYSCLRRLSDQRGAELFSPRWAWLASALWCIHPLNTESVVGIAQRSELLVAVLYLGVCHGFLIGVASSGRARAFGWGYAWLCAWLGMAAKEVMVTAPVVVLLLDRAFVAKNFASIWRERRRFYVPLVASWSVLATLLWAGGGTRGQSAGLGLAMSPWDYFLQQAEANALYLVRIVWPHPLVVDYGVPVPEGLADVWLPGLAVVVLVLGTAVLWRIRPRASFVGVWWFVILSPSSSFVPLISQTMAEHRVYLPLVAPVVALVWCAARYLRGAAYPVVGGCLVLGLALTVLRQQDYRTVETLWRQNATAYPSNPRGHLNLGVELLSQGRAAEARTAFQEAVRLMPHYALAHYNLGQAWQTEKAWSEARSAYREALRFAPSLRDAKVNLGVVLAAEGDLLGALHEWESVVAEQPSADVHYNRARVASALSLNDVAAQAYREALALEPKRVDWWGEAAGWAAQKERWDDAEFFWLGQLKQVPSHVEALGNLGNVALMTGRADRAIQFYEQALRLRPGDSRLQQNLEIARQSRR